MNCRIWTAIPPQACLTTTIHMETITNENLGIYFAFGLVMERQKHFPCFVSCFGKDHLGHTKLQKQVTLMKSKSQRFSFAFACSFHQRENLKSWDVEFFCALAIPAAIYRSAQGAGLESAPRSAF